MFQRIKKKKRRRLLILSARGEKKSNSCSVRANYLEEVNHFNCFLKRLWRAASGLVPGILVLRDLKSEWLRRERYRLNFALGYLREADASFTLCAERASESFAPEVRWRAAVFAAIHFSSSKRWHRSCHVPRTKRLLLHSHCRFSSS